MFGLSLNTILLVVAVVAVLAVFSPAVARFLMRSKGSLEAGVDELGRRIGGTNPLAQLKTKVEDLASNISQWIRDSDAARGTLNTAARRLKELETEHERLTNRCQTIADSGDPNKTLTENVEKLTHCEEQLEKAQAKLKYENTNYENFTKKVKSGQKALLELREKSREKGQELAESETEKRITQQLASFDAESVTGEANELLEALDRQIDANRGAVDNAKQFTSTTDGDAKDDELVRQRKTAEVMARFQKPADKA